MSLQRASSSDSADREAYNPLAAFRYLPVSPAVASFLRRLNVLLASYSGIDRVMMIVQYAGPLIGAGLVKSIPHIKLNNGKVSGARRTAFASSAAILSGKLSDARMLGRFFGLVPIISWMLSLESKASASMSSRSRNLQRLQAWSMLAYYPLEHTYYLAAHGIITLTAEKRLKAILWACRAWAVYVMLQLVLLGGQARSLAERTVAIQEKRQRSASPSAVSNEKDQSKVDTDQIVKDAGAASEDATLVVAQQELEKESVALVNSLTTNLAYAPLTVHWSLPTGLFGNELWSNVFMTIAGLSGLRASWRAIQ